MKFKLKSNFKASGDQPYAIKKLYDNYLNNVKNQVLLGVTGSGKTFVMANIIEKLQIPTLILSPNKILAAQTYGEFKSFFPNNSVEFFVSYYDYYQPEAYVPSSDTYIGKDTSINEYIDKLRLKTIMSLSERNDVIVISSISCIYNLGSPENYYNMCIKIKLFQKKKKETFLEELIVNYYKRNDYELKRGNFRVKGDNVEVFLSYLDIVIKFEFNNDVVESIKEIDYITGKTISKKNIVYIYPAKIFVNNIDNVKKALNSIKKELNERLIVMKKQNMLVEAQRLEQRTKYDIDMLSETGSCNGIENYSRHLLFNKPGMRPITLIDYFIKMNQNYLTIIDESHISIPQINGMYEGDRSRKQTLIDFGFRLPSALDNRPLKFSEFEKLLKKTMFVSATPGKYELNIKNVKKVDLIIRPTGLVDPTIIVKPTKGQINDLIDEINKRIKKNQRSLIITITKKISEDLTFFLKEKGFKVEYLHSEIKTLQRIEMLKNFRLGKFNILVGVNLLREGLDLPEVSLVIILDADKEGFLRSESTLIQICGRASRNVNGCVIFYASKITESMKKTIDEINRRRKKQIEYNEKYHIIPKTIKKEIYEFNELKKTFKQENKRKEFVLKNTDKNINIKIKKIKAAMNLAAKNFDFEYAAILRDKMFELEKK
jgi:excinuclease ABC subunit B